MRLFSRAASPAPTARIRRASLTASASKASSSTGNQNRRLHQPWQAQALDYYNTIGECWYPAQFYARTLARVRFFPAVLDEKGDPQEEESGPLVDLFERIQDPGGGRSDLTGTYARLMFLTGDGYLTAGFDDDYDDEVWEFLSPLELRTKPDSGSGRRQEYTRLRAPGATQEELIEAPDSDFEPVDPNQVRVWRLYRRHPTYSRWADSPVHAVLDLYELLRTLTASAGAESTSRLDRGLFYIPEEMKLGGPPTEDGGSEDPAQDIFLQEWIEAMTTAIKNPGDAAAMSPLMMSGPGYVTGANGQIIAMKDLMGYVQVGRQNDYKEAEMWDKTILRISYGLDLPKERVTGVGDLNHWSGWLVDEEGFRQHVAPIAEKFCADVNAAYLRPAAMAEGISDADRVVIGFDPADAINHPDEVKTAREAYLAAVVGGDFYRDRIGATEADAPDEEEKAFILALQGKSLPGEEDDPEAETNPAEGGRGGDTEEEMPEMEDAEGQNGNGQRSQVAAARLGAAIEMHLERARETAGHRLVRRSQSCEECKETIKDVPASLVASALGPEQVRDIINGHTTEADLLDGTGERVAATVIRWGIPAHAADELGSLVEQHALRTLYEPDAPSLPTDLSLAVWKALAA